MRLEHIAVFPQKKKRAGKSAAVHCDLKRKILLGELTPDSPITEQSLARDYDCSQSTVREALLNLQEDGLVVRRGYEGTFVTNTSDDEAVIMIRLRLDIETAVIDQVIDKMSCATMRQLRSLAEKYDDARYNRDRFQISETDLAFHMIMLRVADTPVLEPVLMRTLLNLHRYILNRHADNTIWKEDIEASHWDLLDAIQSGDRALARKLCYSHATTSTIEVAAHVKETVFARVDAADRPQFQGF